MRYRWVTIRVDILGSVLSAVLAAYLTYRANLSASNAAFEMEMAVGFSTLIIGWMKMFYEFHVTGALSFFPRIWIVAVTVVFVLPSCSQ